MNNSLFVFLAALIFLVFGYASFVRIAYKHYFTDADTIQGEVRSQLISLISTVGQYTVFIMLTGTGLLLFWGWGIAILWMIAFHLLAETTYNMQQSNAYANPRTTENADLTANKLLIESVWQIYLLLIISVIVTLLISLISYQTGLIFAIAVLLPAHSMLKKTSSGSTTPLSIGLALIVFSIGLLLSHELGISIYGSFNPIDLILEQPAASKLFAWLSFDNTSIFTIALIIVGYLLSTRGDFRDNLSYLNGVLILLALLILVSKLIWSMPIVDAPLNSLQTRAIELPAFSSLGLFVFAGLSTLLLREQKTNSQKTSYKKITDAMSKTNQAPGYFLGLQLSSLCLTLFSITLLLTLACALGIGAWSTHYVDWGNVSNLADHFNLSVTATLSLLDGNANAGTLTYSLVATALVLCGFATVLSLIAQLNKSTQQAESKISNLTQSTALQILIIYIISRSLIEYGISIDLWLIIGMLAWLLFTHKLVTNSLTYTDQGRSQIAQHAISLLFMISGVAQIIWTALRWVQNSQWGFCAAAAVILLLALVLWKNHALALIKPFKQQKPSQLF